MARLTPRAAGYCRSCQPSPWRPTRKPVFAAVQHVKVKLQPSACEGEVAHVCLRSAVWSQGAPDWNKLRQLVGRDGDLRLSHFRRVKQLGSGDVGLVDLVQIQVHASSPCLKMQVLRALEAGVCRGCIRLHCSGVLLACSDDALQPSGTSIPRLLTRLNDCAGRCGDAFRNEDAGEAGDGGAQQGATSNCETKRFIFVGNVHF